MNRRHSIIGSALSAAFVSGVAFITILGLFAEVDTSLALIAEGFLQIVTVVAAFGVLIGVLNLLIFVHLRRLLEGKRGALYSFALLLSAILIIGVYSADRSELWTGDLAGEQLSPRLYQVTQTTIESAIAGLVLFSLVYGAFRLMRRQVKWDYLLFLSAMVIALVGWLPLDGLEAFADLRDWLLRIPVTGGIRGLLIGVGLGSVVVGIRVLLAQERFYQRRP